MNKEQQLNLQANRILGEFIGTIEGVLTWDIPDELRKLLNVRLEKLNEVKIISVTDNNE